jgi:hypothetical protein
MQMRTIGVAAIAAFVFVSETAMAQSCPWWNPFQNHGGQVSGGLNIVNTHNGQTGQAMSGALVVIDFWGNYWLTHTNDLNTISNVLVSGLSNSGFWSALSQYGASGTLYQNPSTQLFYVINQTDLQATGPSPLLIDDGLIQSRLPNEPEPTGSNTVSLIVLGADVQWSYVDGMGNRQVEQPGTGQHSSFVIGSTRYVYGRAEYSSDTTHMNLPGQHEVMEALTNTTGNAWYGTTTAITPPTGSQVEVGDACNFRREQVAGVMWHQIWLQNRCQCDGDGSLGVFWNTNSNYNPGLIGDWSMNQFKAMNSPGQPLIGVTEDTGEGHLHGVIYGSAFSQNSYRYIQSQGCRRLLFDGNPNDTSHPDDNPAPASTTQVDGDWDPGFYKAECGSLEYVAGVSQSQTGQVNGILCCTGAEENQHTQCNQETIYDMVNHTGVDSNGYANNPSVQDYDPGFYKGLCQDGTVVVGLSAQQPGQDHPGQVHSLQCCSMGDL